MYYQEITITPASNIGVYFIWKQLYRKIHHIISLSSTTIGVSFPEYQDDFLGTKLRLFANTNEQLENLELKLRCERLSEWLHISSPTVVPEHDSYITFYRSPRSQSRAVLARRRAKRHNTSVEEAMDYYKSYEPVKHDCPYITMSSRTNNNHFRLFIEKEEADSLKFNKFSSYGLSKQGSVPSF